MKLTSKSLSEEEDGSLSTRGCTLDGETGLTSSTE